MAPAKGAIVSDDSEPQVNDEDLRVPDLDIGGDLTGTDLDEVTPTPDGAGDEGVGFGRRLVGILALALGVIGCLIALFLAFSSLRVLFGASDRADGAMAPVVESFDRLDTRIDQADDLVDREGVDGEDGSVLRARVDGLVDIATGAERSFDAIDDHPLYALLPADLSPLGDAIDRFAASADVVDETMGSSTTVRAAAAGTIADEIDGMQSSVLGAREDLDDAAGSLRSWLRIGGLLGFLVSLWGLWSQIALARRGWRGLRNRPV